MGKTEGKVAIEWIWKVCLAPWKSDHMPDDETKVVIVPLYKGKWSIKPCKITKE